MTPPTPPTRPLRRHQRGFVLIVVIFFTVLLFSSVAVFLRRATVDSIISRNRDHAARAEALARGGVQLAIALVLQDLQDEVTEDSPVGLETGDDAWALAGSLQVPVDDGGELHLQIEDTGALLNLNALMVQGKPHDAAEGFLTDFLGKVIEEMPGRPEEKLYDAGELARNLLDYLDKDDVRLRGGDENDYYRDQTPPYDAPNRPLLAVAEIGLVEGFDTPLVAAIRPYITVYPYVAEGAVNLNTAPDWVLASLQVKTGSQYERASEARVRDILRVRERGEFLCPDTHGNERCVDYGVEVGEIFPLPMATASTFSVRSEARYGNVSRHVEAVIDRSDPEEPRVLSWRVR